MTKKEYYNICGLSPKWHESTFKDYSNDKEAKEKVLTLVNDYGKYEKYPKGVGGFLVGSNGTGKTFLMHLSMKEFIMRKIPCRIYNMDILVSAFCGAWYNEADKLFIEAAKKIPILGIDDLSKEYKSLRDDNKDIVTVAFDNLLRYRVQKQLPTWFTSNLNPEKISDYYSPDIASMLCECALIIPVAGRDYRKKIQQKLQSI